MDFKRVGLNIAKRRKQQGLLQRELSEATGITQQKISLLEVGENLNPGINTLQRIAAALNCDVVDLMLETESGSDLLNS